MVDLELSRTRLEKELARVSQRIADLKQEREPEELSSGGDNTPLSEAVDSAVAAQERNLHQELLGGLLDRIATLEQALQKVADGTYGWCDACYVKIPESRLGVLPEVSLCAPCQARREEGASRKRRKRSDERSMLYK